jgi:hypothetical protein
MTTPHQFHAGQDVEVEQSPTFFLGWAIPIALTGLALPWPYNQLFYSAGAALAILGILVLLVAQFTGKD